MTPAGKVCISSMPVFSIDQTGLVEIGADGQGWQDLAAPLDAQSVVLAPGERRSALPGQQPAANHGTRPDAV